MSLVQEAKSIALFWIHINYAKQQTKQCDKWTIDSYFQAERGLWKTEQTVKERIVMDC